MVEGPSGATDVDARPSDALALAMVVGAPSGPTARSSRPPNPTTPVAEALAAVDSQQAVGAQALLDEMTGAGERQDPPEPAGS